MRFRLYVQKNENDYDKIIFSSRINDTKQYIFYLFYTKYDPASFQSGKDIEKIIEKNGWIRIKRIGKIYFLPSISLSPSDLKLPLSRILLAGAEEEFPSVIKTKYKIKDPKNNTVFSLVDFNENLSLLANQANSR